MEGGSCTKIGLSFSIGRQALFRQCSTIPEYQAAFRSQTGKQTGFSVRWALTRILVHHYSHVCMSYPCQAFTGWEGRECSTKQDVHVSCTYVRTHIRTCAFTQVPYVSQPLTEFATHQLTRAQGTPQGTYLHTVKPHACSTHTHAPSPSPPPSHTHSVTAPSLI